MVFALVFARGTINAADFPTRQSFAIEMVGSDRVVNAVSLNSVLIHSARILGPATAGVLIATVGVGTCFLVNALSFGAMIVALVAMDPGELRAAPLASRGAGAIRAALRYVRRTPALAIPLAMMALVGTLGYNFQVILPLLARFSFEGGAAAYTALVVAMGAGSVLGALVAGARGRVGPRLLVAVGVQLRSRGTDRRSGAPPCRSRRWHWSRWAPPASPSRPASTPRSSSRRSRRCAAG